MPYKFMLDAEELKKRIYWLDSKEALEEGIIPLIDSLAVEVKEGAVDNAIDWLESEWANSKKKYLEHTRGRVIQFARAEHAALQAEIIELREYAKQATASDIKLRTEIVNSDKRDIAIKMNELESENAALQADLKRLRKESEYYGNVAQEAGRLSAENGILKGALRTLAKSILENKCPVNYPCVASECRISRGAMTCVDAIEAYALAHPTSEQ